MTRQTIYALIHCDSTTGPGSSHSTAHLTDADATRAGAELARTLWPIYTEGREGPFPAHLDTDNAAMESLHDFEDVTVEVEEITIGDDVVAELARRLPDSSPAGGGEAPQKTYRVVGFWDDPTDVADMMLSGSKPIPLAAFALDAADTAFRDPSEFFVGWAVQVEAGSAEEALLLAPARVPVDEETPEQP